MSIRIDGTNTAANPGITGTDTDTGLQFGTDEVNIVTGGSARATVDSSGRLLVGTTSDSQTSTAVLQGSTAGASQNAVFRLCLGSSSPVDGQTLGFFAFGDSGHTTAASIQAVRDGGTWTSGTSQPARLQFSTAVDGTSSPTEQMRLTSTGDLRFNSGYGSVATAYGCRAWINFDGTAGTIGSGRGSGNVSTVTDNGTGDYTVNFATAMPDANYSVVSTGDNTNALIVRLNNNEAVPATGSVRLSTVNTSFASADILFCNVAVFR